MKSKLLMLIISSFVFISCTVDTKQRYQISDSMVLDTYTGKVAYCENVDGMIYCTKQYDTQGKSRLAIEIFYR